MVLIIGQYESAEIAGEDLDYILDDREEHLVSLFDAAVVVKGEDGKVRIERKIENAVSMGAWGGLLIGGVLGLVYPPALLEIGAIGAATGAVVGHLSKGMSSADIKLLGETLDATGAALVIAVDASSADRTQSIMGRATAVSATPVEANATDIDAAIEEAANA
jgi:uncharacterized membrane protein